MIPVGKGKTSFLQWSIPSISTTQKQLANINELHVFSLWTSLNFVFLFFGIIGLLVLILILVFCGLFYFETEIANTKLGEEGSGKDLGGVGREEEIWSKYTVLKYFN